MLQEILFNYSVLLDLDMWIAVLSNPSSIGLIMSLILLECLLSTDNALVLSTLVKPLDEKDQKKALFYGLFGAYFFRFLLVGIGTYLINFWIIKALGSLYLFFLAANYFYKKHNYRNNNSNNTTKKGFLTNTFGFFWATVINIELMDVVFSIDSILTAIAISNNIFIVMLGGLIGILCMRGVASAIISLMEKIPELEITAYILIFFISIKMFITLFDYDIPNNLFLSFMTFCFAITLLINYLNNKKI